MSRTPESRPSRLARLFGRIEGAHRRSDPAREAVFERYRQAAARFRAAATELNDLELRHDPMAEPIQLPSEDPPTDDVEQVLYLTSRMDGDTPGLVARFERRRAELEPKFYERGGYRQPRRDAVARSAPSRPAFQERTQRLLDAQRERMTRAQPRRPPSRGLSR